MCYNCGCGMLKDDMGNPLNITEKTFEEAAKVVGISADDAKRNVLEELKRSLDVKGKEERAA